MQIDNIRYEPFAYLIGRKSGQHVCVRCFRVVARRTINGVEHLIRMFVYTPIKACIITCIHQNGHTCFLILVQRHNYKTFCNITVPEIHTAIHIHSSTILILTIVLAIGMPEYGY